MIFEVDLQGIAGNGVLISYLILFIYVVYCPPSAYDLVYNKHIRERSTLRKTVIYLKNNLTGIKGAH